jgi:alpha-glucosidase
MPWRAEAPLAGFTDAARTWLPVDPAHRPLAVDIQEDDPDSTLNFTRAVIAVRRASAALRCGEVRLAEAPAGVLAFERVEGPERVLCVFELDGQPARASLKGLDGAMILMAWQGAEVGADGVDLQPYGGVILQLPSER